MAIRNGPTRSIATPTGQASRRPGQASPEPGGDLPPVIVPNFKLAWG